jgi:hypothetical protein
LHIPRFCIAGLVAATAPLLMAPPTEGCSVCTARLVPDVRFRLSVRDQSLWQEFEVTEEGQHFVEVSVDSGEAEIDFLALSPSKLVRLVRCDGDALYALCEFHARPGGRVGLAVTPVSSSSELRVAAGMAESHE